jgi:nitroreductase
MQSILEIIKQRKSVRNFEKRPIEKQTLDKINNYIKTLDNPFSPDIRFKILPAIQEDSNIKLGTYGMVKNAPAFIVASNNGSKLSELAIGYTLEKIVLYCTSLGLGTCWIAGTFNKNSFSKSFVLSENEKVFAISPLGYPIGKRAFLEKLIGADSKHASRKPFEQIFFINNWNTALSQDNAGEYALPLEMLRLSPSAMNKQPWKLLVLGDQVSFFLDKSVSSYIVDIGIAMCHFEVACNELGIKGKFTKDMDSQVEYPSKYEYVMTWNKSK